MTHDIIIIGSGIAGLSAAMALRASSNNVLLLESSARPGGRAQSIQRAGYAFNLGAHALYPGPLARALKKWGIHLGLDKPNLKTGMMAFEQTIQEMPNSPIQMMTAPLFKDQRVHTMKCLASIFTTRRQDWAGKSIALWIEAQTEQPTTRAFLQAMARLTNYSGELDKLDGAHALNQMRMGLRGVHYVQGGWQTIVDQLVERIEQAPNIEIKTRCAVKSVKQLDALWQVTTKNQTTFTARHVIMATAPQKCISWCSARPWQQKLNTQIQTQSPVIVSALDLLVSKSPKSTSFVLGLDVPYYFNNASMSTNLKTDEDAPDGELWHLVHYTPHQSDDPRHDLNQWLDHIQPGWQNHVITQHYSPKLQTMSALPDPTKEAIPVQWAPGLYCASDGTGSHGALADRSVNSALYAVKQIQKGHI